MPNTSWDGTAIIQRNSFTAKVVAADGAESSPFTILLNIQNVNDPTEILFEKANNTLLLTQTDLLNSYKYFATTLSGFKVIDPDKGADPIKVELQTSAAGKVEINKDDLSYLDFNSQRYCEGDSPLPCEGDGTLARRMVFVTSSNALEKALNRLYYQRPQGTTEPEDISITIYDGVVSNLPMISYFSTDQCLRIGR